MRFLRFLLNSTICSLLTLLYASWALDQSEAQLGKMQDAVFNTPGSEAPLPPKVVFAALGLLALCWTLGRKLFALKDWQTLLSIVAGIAGGLLSLFLTNSRRST